MSATFAPAAGQTADGKAPEAEIALDLVRRGLPMAPVAILVAAAVAGFDGMWSAAFAIALVLGNFVVSAAFLSGAARISVAMVMGAALFGYLARLGVISGAVLLVKDQGWVHLPVLGVTLIATHLGLLFWETRFVSASLAFPGLTPTASAPGPRAVADPSDVKE